MAQKATTRRTIVEAAGRCFTAKGFDDTAIADIATAAGVAHGTFYVHFRSKEALLDELLLEFNETFARQLAAVVAGGAAGSRSLRTQVQVIARAFVEHWLANRQLVRWYASRRVTHLGTSDLRDGLHPPLVRLLGAALTTAAAARGGELRDADLVTHGLLALWLRLGLQLVLGRAARRDDVEWALVEMTLGALQGVLPGARRGRDGQA